MKNFFIIIVACLMIYGCKPGIPKDIIQPEKMEAVLYDIHVIDAYTSTFPSQDSAKKIVPAYYKGIYKKFEIDSALHQKSMNYYYAHPDLFKEMYDRISAKLNKEKDKKAYQQSVQPISVK